MEFGFWSQDEDEELSCRGSMLFLAGLDKVRSCSLLDGGPDKANKITSSAKVDAAKFQS